MYLNQHISAVFTLNNVNYQRNLWLETASYVPINKLYNESWKPSITFRARKVTHVEITMVKYCIKGEIEIVAFV